MNVAMVSVCATCKGLQKHLHGLDGAQENGANSLLWVNSTLPNLRSSSSACRACALLLNGVLLHHDRFAGVNEDSVRVKAQSFGPKQGKSSQEHLSVELRWKESDDHDGCHDEEHEHTAGNADLKLEFFTDGGMDQAFSDVFQSIICMAGVMERSSTASLFFLHERVD
jgi:hypothetical protein